MMVMMGGGGGNGGMWWWWERNVPERELWVVENKSVREEEYQPIRVRVGPP